MKAKKGFLSVVLFGAIAVAVSQAQQTRNEMKNE